MNQIVLRRVIQDHNKSSIVLVVTGLFLTLYFLSGNLFLGKPGYFILTYLDEIFPYLPWTSFIYILMYPVLFWCFFELKSNSNQNRLLYAFVFLSVISNLIFIVYPVVYPRELFPTPYQNEIGVNLLRTIRYLDKPINCFPSLHVSSLFLFTYALWNESKIKFIIALLLSITITISTFTTKQHYVVDALSGLILATIIYYVFWNIVAISDD